MRVGIGYDVHPLRAGRDLILGGVRIDHPTGLDGHSDADVLTHAVIDAVIGAAGLGDIGTLLSSAMEAVRGAGYRVVNVDCTLIAQEPRLQPHMAAMKSKLAERVGTDQVNIKGKSPEGLGALGQMAGIAAQAVATIEEVKHSPPPGAARRPPHGVGR